jgi:hypothetical protein
MDSSYSPTNIDSDSEIISIEESQSTSSTNKLPNIAYIFQNNLFTQELLPSSSSDKQKMIVRCTM